MPAVSKKQQRLFGIIRAIKKGVFKGKKTSKVQRIASSISDEDSKKMASTKHEGLPEKIKEDYVKELEDGLVKMDYPTYMEVDELMKKIAKENDIDTTTLHMAFKTKHLMVPDDWAKKKMMEPVMIPKTPQITGDVKEESHKSKLPKYKQKFIDKQLKDIPTRTGGETYDTKDLKLTKKSKLISPKKGEVMDEAITAKERFKRDAGKIAKNKLRQKEHEKYVNFLNVDEAVNRKQQAAIAISKKQRLMDLMVAKKKKLKEEQNPEGMKYSDKKKIERQELLKKASAKAPVVKNKIVPIKISTKEEVIYEYDGNYHMNKIAKEKGLDLTDPRQRRRANSLARKNAAKGNVNNPMGRKKRKLRTEGNLHKWFKGSKSKDGKGGWVNVVTGGTCASDEPGEGTPKCVSSSKRASMTKAERLSASRRKKKADPGQQSKSGAAKPTYVSTDKPKKKVNEDVEGRKTALTEPKTTKEKLARKKDSEIRREAERSMYDSSAGESEIAKRTRIAKKLRSSTDPKNQDKGKQMEIDTTKKLVGEEFGKMTKEQEDIYVGNKAGRIKFDKITDYKKRQQLKKNLRTYEGDEDKTTTTAESYSSKSTNQVKKAKLAAALDRLENLKVKKKMNEEAWQRKEGKNQSGGLNEKGRKSYERANPGSDLKAPSKKKGNKRRKSFCARMKGMKSKLTSAKTARDPDSRINKSLRAWNCSYEPEHGEVISEGKDKKVSKMIKSLKRKTKVLEKGQKKERDAGAIAAKIMREKEHNKYVNFLPMDEEKKKCGEGEYYCNDDKKCKPIPKGYKVGYGGYLKPENENDESNGKKGGSNGNGNGHGGNGNGHGGNGNGGNGGGNGGGE